MNIELFNFHGNEVRVIADDADKPCGLPATCQKFLALAPQLQ